MKTKLDFRKLGDKLRTLIFTGNYVTTIFFVLLLMTICVEVYANDSDEKAFKANCGACHALNENSTGPSLVYIKEHYPETKREAFLAWVKSPGKKNPDRIQMPAISYLDNDTLVAIHRYILDVSKSQKQKVEKPKFTSYKPPQRAYPQVTRHYLPFTSPASIAIALNPELTVVWDSTIAKLRYVYPTGAAFNGEKRREKSAKAIMYRESSDVLFSFANNKKTVFKGYQLIEGEPEFHYQVGNVEVKERIYLGRNERSFVRKFTVTGAKQDVVLTLVHSSPSSIRLNGKPLTGDNVHLTPEQVMSFNIEVEL